VSKSQQTYEQTLSVEKGQTLAVKKAAPKSEELTKLQYRMQGVLQHYKTVTLSLKHRCEAQEMEIIRLR